MGAPRRKRAADQSSRSSGSRWTIGFAFAQRMPASGIRFDDTDRIFSEAAARHGGFPRGAQGRQNPVYIGFTGHEDASRASSTCWQKATEQGFRFDTVQMPLNVMDGSVFAVSTKLVLPAPGERENRRTGHENAWGNGNHPEEQDSHRHGVSALRVESWPASVVDYGHPMPA